MTVLGAYLKWNLNEITYNLCEEIHSKMLSAKWGHFVLAWKNLGMIIDIMILQAVCMLETLRDDGLVSVWAKFLFFLFFRGDTWKAYQGEFGFQFSYFLCEYFLVSSRCKILTFPYFNIGNDNICINTQSLWSKQLLNVDNLIHCSLVCDISEMTMSSFDDIFITSCIKTLD